MKIYIVCLVPAQILYLEKFWFLRYAGPILDIEGMCAFFMANFLRKGHFVCLHPPDRCHLCPFLMKIFFSKHRALDWVR